MCLYRAYIYRACDVFPSGVSCQRAHWSDHKKACHPVHSYPLVPARRPTQLDSEHNTEGELFTRCQKTAVTAQALLEKGLTLLKSSEFGNAIVTLKRCVTDLAPLTQSLQSVIQAGGVSDYNPRNELFMLQVNMWHELSKILCRGNFALGEALARNDQNESAIGFLEQARQQAGKKISSSLLTPTRFA